MSLALNSTSLSGLEDEVDGLCSRKSIRPKDFQATLHKLYDLVEEMQITTRDNNAILCQMLFDTEQRMSDHIDQVRSEMLDIISNGGFTGIAAAGGGGSPRVSTSEVNNRMGRYNTKPQQQQQLPGRRSFSSNNGHSSSNIQLSQSQQSQFEMVEISPLPGFVIKTRKLLGDKEKVFLNIFHHEYIELEPSEAAKGPATDKPYMVMTQASSAADKDGNVCLMFNLGVSSEYFKQPPNKELEVSITAPSTIHKIIHKVNMKFNEFLDEGNYSLPRLANGFKGGEIPRFTVPVQIQTQNSDGATTNTRNSKNSKNSSGSEAEDVIISRDPSAAAFLDAPSADSTAANPHLLGLAPAGSHAANILSHQQQQHQQQQQQIGVKRGSNASILNDDASVVSDISYDNTTLGNTRRPSKNGGGGSVTGSIGGRSRGSVHRKSIFDISAMAYTGGDIAGRNLLSGEMLDYIVEENVDSGTSDALKTESAKDPSVLLGWQIWLQEHGHNSIYVITDVRKNLVSKTEFRISQFKKEDQWVRLKRSEHKTGLEFRCMRKVLYGLQIEDETQA